MTYNPSPIEALSEAVDRAGGQSAVARLCGVSQTAVWKWLAEGKTLPAEFVLRVESVTGIHRSLLRPDIYPADLGPSPAWHGVDRGEARVAFNHINALQDRAA